MALIFQPPVIRNRQSNPATELTVKGMKNAELLGFTKPMLNGQGMIQGPLLGMLEPRPPNEPNIVYNQLPGGGGWTATINQPVNTVSWEIELPPPFTNGIWKSPVSQKGFELKHTLFPFIEGGKSLTGMPPDYDWTVILRPLPTPVAFWNHILWHEYQHVTDHKWLAEKLIGPWDDWYTTAAQKHLIFTRDKKSGLETGLKLSNYCGSAERIIRYWQKAITLSGDLYHGTAAGASPVLRVEKVAGAPGLSHGKMELHLTISAKQLINNPIDMNSSPHTYFRLPAVQVNSVDNALDGNDAPIAPNGPINPDRSLLAILGVGVAQNGSVIPIPEAAVGDDEAINMDFFNE